MEEKISYPIQEKQIYTEWGEKKVGTYSPPAPYHTKPNNTKKNQPKYLFVVAAFCITSLLGACVTYGLPPSQPYRLPEIQYGGTSESMYLYTQGSNGFTHLRDYAAITRINGTNIPSEIVPYPSDTTYSRLVEFPAGEVVVGIRYSELSWFEGRWDNSGSRRTLAFTGGPNRIYVPFVSDLCSRESFWIEDWGAYESDVKALMYSDSLYSNLTQPVVAGEAPRKGACE